MGKSNPRLAARTGAGRVAQTRAALAEAAAQAEGLLGRKVLAKATRPDLVQNAENIDQLRFSATTSPMSQVWNGDPSTMATMTPTRSPSRMAGRSAAPGPSTTPTSWPR